MVPILNKEYDRGRVNDFKRRLDGIPPGLHDLFLDILARDGNSLAELVRCLQCVLFASRPPSPSEFYAALLTPDDEGAKFLVWCHPERGLHIQGHIRSGDYSDPLLAAMYAEHKVTAMALIGKDPSELMPNYLSCPVRLNKKGFGSRPRCCART